MQTLPVTSFNFSPTLVEGDRAINVVILQGVLVLDQYLSSSKINGIFASSTDNAVRQFQHDNGLYEDKIVEPHTWTVLTELGG
jgi:peptidoglycan hydrolase-like protein with peptidoglycan-binding domain